MSVLFIKVTVLFSTYQELAVRKVATNEGEKEKKRLNTELKKLMQTLQNVTTQKMALMESSCADRQVLEQRQEKTTALQNQLEDAKATLEELRTGHVTEKKSTNSRQTLRQRLTSGELQVAKLESECQQLQVAIK